MKDVSFLTGNGVNIKSSLEIFGDMDTYNESLEDFLSEVGTKLSNIDNYKEVSDMSNYAILVHSLKSDAKYFGFEYLADLAYKHEIESKANNVSFIYDNYKPLIDEANRIVLIVKQYLGKEPIVPIKPVSVEPVVQTIKDKSILVVDDSNIVRNFLVKLMDPNYDIIMAGDGKEAINIIEANMDNNKIKGMLLDLNMPNVDGFAVLDYFKENGLFNKIPVSIITGNDSKEIDERAFTYPIVDMLKKPFNERDVDRILERTISFNSEQS